MEPRLELVSKIDIEDGFYKNISMSVSQDDGKSSNTGPR